MLEEYGFDQETGKPHIGTLATAVQVYALANDRCSVIQAAEAFNETVERINEAIEWHPHLYRFGMTIEYDGE